MLSVGKPLRTSEAEDGGEPRQADLVRWNLGLAFSFAGLFIFWDWMFIAYIIAGLMDYGSILWTVLLGSSSSKLRSEPSP